ncbi:unnamed protein product [Arctogadus glacialis]
MSAVLLQQYREKIRTELDRVVSFWLTYSHDTKYGGFFTCIDKKGQVYDDLKYVWLQGRQVWMYCRLYRTMERFHKQEILQAAKAGGEFLRQFARVPSDSPTWKCAFCLTKDGKPVKIQRSIFSECFYIMAMDELSRVTGDKDMQTRTNAQASLGPTCARGELDWPLLAHNKTHSKMKQLMGGRSRLTWTLHSLPPSPPPCSPLPWRGLRGPMRRARR